ncbi:MAG: phosphonate monoester hydrolase, partial [Rhizobiales bacterium]|nr:phosphonate monoester hydrolase [Hyphomicrobiales bacterium]
YSATPMAMRLGLAPRDARLFMIADKRWKFMHAEGGIRPMLFDLESDPEEYYDLGASTAHGEIIDLMYQRLGQWGRRLSQRTTKSEQDILNMRGKSRGTGVLLGVYDGSDVEPELLTRYSGKARRHIEDPGPGD